MAIVEMNKLKLAAMKQDRYKLLRELIRLGCVQLTELSLSEEQLSALTPEDSGEAARRRGELSELQAAIDILDAYAPVKASLLSSPPEISPESFLEEGSIPEMLEKARHISGTDERIRKISAEESRERGTALSLSPWLSLDLDLAVTETEKTDIILGSVSAKSDMERLRDDVSAACEEAEICEISRDKTAIYIVIICIKEARTQVLSALKPYVFTPAPLSGLTGTPVMATQACRQHLEALAAEKTELINELIALAEGRDSLKLAADRVTSLISMAEAAEKLRDTDSCILMQGWIPAETEPQLAHVLEGFDCAWDTEAPDPEEYEQVPVKLKNNRFTNALNMVTNMYSLPLYGTVDPNPLMAPFFILFYGLMMADMGYGLIMIAAALVAFRKLKPRGGTLSFCQLLLYGGISTFICGALTGGFFSDVIAQFVTLATGTEWSMPYLFSPVNDSELVLYGSLVLGVIHLNTGMAINFVQKLKRGETAGAIWEEGSLWVILVGAVLWFLDILNISGIPVVLIIGCVMLLLGAGREKKGFGKVTAAIACIYNTSTGWLGDVLSYARIMALMLAGGVVGQVFNSVAIMPMQGSGANVGTVLVFIVIFIAGHAMNFALNILGCYVHDLRLQCLEFFGKFYTDGGKPFTPLEIKGRYNRAKQ